MMAEGCGRRHSDGSFHSAQSASFDSREQTQETIMSPHRKRESSEGLGDGEQELPEDGSRRQQDGEVAPTGEAAAANRRGLTHAEGSSVQQDSDGERDEQNGWRAGAPAPEEENNNQEEAVAVNEAADDGDDEGWEEVASDDEESSSDDSEDSSESSATESDDDTNKSDADAAEEEENLPLGCAHYRRKCKAKEVKELGAAFCSTCGARKVFWCRHCHNEATETDPDRPHEINRHAVEELICAACETRQGVSNKCVNCEAVFGKYYCSICKFWDDQGEKKKVYHCDECGICRSGGRDKYFHCPTCNSCYPMQLQNKHKCLENAMRRQCPVCLEDMFSSLRQSQVLMCGHTLHSDCLRLLQRQRGFQSIRCPMCSKSIADYSEYWKQLSDEIERTPMEDQFKRKVRIVCNDCLERSTTDFHFLGLKCSSCNSFNTREIADE